MRTTYRSRRLPPTIETTTTNYSACPHQAIKNLRLLSLEQQAIVIMPERWPAAVATAIFTLSAHTTSKVPRKPLVNPTVLSTTTTTHPPTCHYEPNWKQCKKNTASHPWATKSGQNSQNREEIRPGKSVHRICPATLTAWANFWATPTELLQIWMTIPTSTSNIATPSNPSAETNAPKNTTPTIFRPKAPTFRRWHLSNLPLIPSPLRAHQNPRTLVTRAHPEPGPTSTRWTRAFLTRLKK